VKFEPKELDRVSLVSSGGWTAGGSSSTGERSSSVIRVGHFAGVSFFNLSSTLTGVALKVTVKGSTDSKSLIESSQFEKLMFNCSTEKERKKERKKVFGSTPK